jgi:hypothetical protein
VVLSNGVRPFSKEADQRLNSAFTLNGMLGKNLPLLVSWTTRLVQNFRWNGKLANVVQ